MYKLLGSDQKEYGPVSADQVRSWISQGRANGRSKLQAAGSSEWKTLAEFPEFADALKAMTGGAPLPGGQGQPSGVASKTSGMAVTSLVLGCLGCTSPIGLVLGIIALVRINKSQGRLRGQGLALAGIIVSAVLLLVGLLSSAMVLPALSSAKAKATRTRCVNNVRQLSVALMMYAADHNDQFPAGTNWCDALMPYLSRDTKAFICLQGPAGQRCHYALNAQLAGRATQDLQVPAKTVLIFECEGGWNVSGGLELLPATPRHANVHVVGFADGHVESLSPNRLDKLRWEP